MAEHQVCRLPVVDESGKLFTMLPLQFLRIESKNFPIARLCCFDCTKR